MSSTLELHREKTNIFDYAKTNTQISFAVTAKLISAFVFASRDSTIILLPKSEILSLKPSSVAVQPGLCRTRLEFRMLVFSRHRSFKCFKLCLVNLTRKI